jgi:hypothetical protein
MRRLQVKLTPELLTVLDAMSADGQIKIGPFIEETLRRESRVEKKRKQLKVEWSERRKVGKPRHASDDDV